MDQKTQVSLKERLNPKGWSRGKYFAVCAAILFVLITFTATTIYIFTTRGDKPAEEIVTQDPADEADEDTKPEEEELDEQIEEEQTEEPSPEPSPLPSPTPSPEPGLETAPDPAPEPTANWWSYPTPTLATTRSGDDLLVLVNKQYQLPSTYAPSDLVNLAQQPNLNIRLTSTFYLRSIVINDLRNLANAAQAAGLDMSIKSAYRSYATQQSTYQYWVNYNGGSVDAADQVSARAGHSQHQLGTAVDFSSSEVGDQIGAVFHDTAAAAWLGNHAWEYGFVIAYPQGAEEITRYAYESWHYRYIGVANAAEWRASGKTLEEWLAERN
ncbi:MAG: M15 family metallopeptidase [Candidatus Dojkabacteria bacterium]|nr:MAG: M15 family metallopeptidase [Candidatus Dojkabacteria bacterium]